MTWAVVSEGIGGFSAKPEAEMVETDYLVARHPDEASAVEGVERAQKLEQQMRPLWLAAFEHERRVKNAMLDAVYAAARPVEPINEGENR